MNPPKMNRKSPTLNSAQSLAPVAATLYRDAIALLFTILAILMAAMPLRAQEAQAYEPGARMISNGVEHSAPQPKVVFTDSPREGQEAAGDQGAPALAHAENASDDFDNNTPTAWWIYTGQTVADVDSTIKTDNARIIDIQVDSFSPYSFTVTYVKNTGAYAKSWYWYFGLTAAQVATELTSHDGRLISLKAYDIGGGKIRFAVVMIANKGADQKGWWWYYGETGADLEFLLTTNKARLITLDSYTTGGNTLYSAIMISNAAPNNVGWYWWYNSPPAKIASTIQNDNARVIYLASAGNGNFNAVLESCVKGCSEWWWYYGFGDNPAGMLDTAAQNGARPVSLSSYACGSETCYAAAMINNSNAITTRVGNLIRNGGIGGTEGLYLRQVSGPGTPGVLANLEDNVVFEPASTIKVLANLYAMTRVEAGTIKLTTPITHYTNGPESCPNPPVVDGTEPLGTALREMMWHSDNARTREITDHFGDTKINNYAKSIGMLHSGFHEIVGCIGTTPDMLTLDDAGTLYAGVANQDFLNAQNRGIFYSNMAGRAQYESEGYDWTAVWDNDIPNIINEVAPAGTTAAQKKTYMNAMNVAYKAGNYVICTNNSCTDVVEDIAISGWFQLPVCSASGTTYAEYVWGIMFSNEPYNGWTSSTVTQTDNNFTTAKSELLREQIAAGMASCKGKSLEVMSYSPADLVFPSTMIGITTPSKSISVVNKQPGTVTGLSVSIFGDFTQTNTCKSSLASGATCTITVTFTPTTAGERTGAVIVADDGSGEPQTIQLTGTGTGP